MRSAALQLWADHRRMWSASSALRARGRSRAPLTEWRERALAGAATALKERERERPRGVPNIGTILQRELCKIVNFKEGGNKKRMKKIELAIRQLVNKAAAGNERAIRSIVQLLQQTGGSVEFKQPYIFQITETDSRL